jgi:hypothetical protein
LLSRFYKERNKIMEMAIIARNKAFPDATTRIGGICMEAING